MDDKTLEYYNLNAEEYAKQTVDTDMKGVIDKFLDVIPVGGNILDLGCGSGRDSRYFLERGYSVTAADGSPELCKIAGEYTGLPVRCMLFQELDYEEEFDGIWACASLHHLQKEELSQTLELVFRALKHGGKLYTCFKYGDSDYDDEKGRHFTCVNEDTVYGLFEGWHAPEVWVTGDRLSCRDLRWINVIAER